VAEDGESARRSAPFQPLPGAEMFFSSCSALKNFLNAV
jgi:hypothetical protein